jgi:thiol-disulfide isomerase/thioredoxin
VQSPVSTLARMSEPASTSPSTSPHRLRDAWTWLRARWYRRWTFDILLFVAIFWVFGRFQARNLLSDAELAPTFVLRGLDGQDHALSDYRGKVVVLQFFAPWCTVCRVESDNWARIQSLKGDSVQVLAIALGYENVQSVVEFMGDDINAYPVLLGNDQIQRAYKVESFPTHYILDRDGRITSQSAGYTTTLGYLMRLL